MKILNYGENIRNFLGNFRFVDRIISVMEKNAFHRIIQKRKKHFVDDSQFMNEHKNLIQELRQQGVIYLPSYFDFSSEEIHFLKKLLLNNGQEIDSVITFYPDPIPEVLLQLYNDIFIEKLIYHARGYGESQKLLRLYLSKPLPEETGSFLWHHDGLFHYYKVLVYLCDVDIQNGPFAYCLGSHNTSWKYYSYSRSRFQESDLDSFEKKYFTGKIGDVIILDANGIHKANNPQPQFERWVASLAFVDFHSNQSTDHIFATEKKLSYLK